MAETLRVIVIGGSLGGLTSALVLRELGCDVQVFERSGSALESRGAGIVLHPMTERFLVEVRGLSVDLIATRASTLRYIDAAGRRVHESPCGYRFTAWNSLYGALLRCLPSELYHLGETLVDFAIEPGRVEARFASGRIEQADLMVCADGINSIARQRLLPHVRPKYAGYVGWRGVIPEADLPPAAADDLGGSIVYHLAPSSHILTYPIPGADGSLAAGRRLINFVWYRNVSIADLPRVMTDRSGVRRDLSVPPGLVATAQVDELRQAAQALPWPIRDVVQLTSEPFIQEIVDVEVPKMAFGRLILCGDSAFVARPHAAAGTAKAAADAWALRDALAACRFDVAAAVARWEQQELDLGRRLLERVTAMGDAAQFGPGWVAGDPQLRFGLIRAGDSEELTVCGRPA